MSRRAGSLLVAVVLALGAVASVAGADMPNPTLTPGVASGDVTQQNLGTTLCVKGFASSVRNVSTATKHRVYAEYHIARAQQRRYVIDHLIPLEVGGANDVANLWPEPKAESKVKDKLENLLHDDVCSGDLTLADAQRIAVGPVDAGLTTAKQAEGSTQRAKAAADAATAQAEQLRQQQIAAYVAAVNQAKLDAYLQAVAAAQADQQRQQQLQQRQQQQSCPNGTYVNSTGSTVCSPYASPSGPPAGATAQCADGSYSFSQHRQGTCSGHGGVSRWL
jgi:hypothetical protein